MNLKSKSFAMLLALATALGFTACSDDSLVGDGAGSSTGAAGSKVFVNAGISLPTTASRSQTDGDGVTNSDGGYNKDGVEQGPDVDYEYGYDYENDVRTMLLVLTNENDEYITHTFVKGITQAPVTAHPFDFIVNAEIEHAKLQEAYAKGGLLYNEDETVRKKVRFYAYANYTDRLYNLFEGKVEGEEAPNGTNWLDWAGKVEEDASPAGQTPLVGNTIWAPRSFLMTNAQVFNVEFPADIDEWDDYADKNFPYDLSGAKMGQTVDGVEGVDAAIRVERAAARIDFRDYSTLKDAEGLSVDEKAALSNTYPIEIVSYLVPTDDDGNPLYDQTPDEDVTFQPYNVKLTRMSLVNMSKNFYYLRRVSGDGKNEKSIIGGVETAKNYVVDTDADVKAQVKGINENNASDYFNFALYNADATYNRAAWYTDNIDDILTEGPVDTWDGAYRGENPYHIWRYVTENTIPASEDGDAVSQQKTVQSVGIVFKGSIKAGKDAGTALYPKVKDDDTEEYYVSQAVRDALAEAAKMPQSSRDSSLMPTLFSFENLLYASPAELASAAIREGEGSTLWGAVNATFGHWILNEETQTFEYSETAATGAQVPLTVLIANDIYNIKNPDKYQTKYGDCKIAMDTEEDLERLYTTAPKNNITIFKASDEKDGEGWGYYCYYFYWNRHNDNLKSGRMGVMEFATVRNNVYKLAVTKIDRFGHPRVPTYDPDPEEPEDPDEPLLDYIKVNVEVLPWVVRVNDIEF